MIYRSADDVATTVQSVIGDTIPALVQVRDRSCSRSAHPLLADFLPCSRSAFTFPSQMMEPFDRVAAVLCAVPRIEPHERRPPTTPLLTADNLTGHVQLIDAKFTYPTEKQKPVLKGLDCEILPGQKVALCGKTGCGKSTCMYLLQNLYRLDSGSLLLDGERIERYDVSAEAVLRCL